MLHRIEADGQASKVHAGRVSRANVAISQVMLRGRNGLSAFDYHCNGSR